MRKQRIALKHRVDIPAIRRIPRDVLSAQKHVSSFRKLESCRNLEKRGLPRAAGAEHRNEFTRFDSQRDLPQDLTPLKALLHGLEFKNWTRIGRHQWVPAGEKLSPEPRRRMPSSASPPPITLTEKSTDSVASALVAGDGSERMIDQK